MYGMDMYVQCFTYIYRTFKVNGLCQLVYKIMYKEQQLVKVEKTDNK